MYYIIKKINVIYIFFLQSFSFKLVSITIWVKSGKCAKWNLHQFQNLILHDNSISIMNYTNLRTLHYYYY